MVRWPKQMAGDEGSCVKIASNKFMVCFEILGIIINPEMNTRTKAQRVRSSFNSFLCNLCVLCVSVVKGYVKKDHHRDTENTEVAQRKPGHYSQGMVLWNSYSSF